MAFVILVVTDETISENNESIICHHSLLHWTRRFDLSNTIGEHENAEEIDDGKRKVKIATMTKKIEIRT